MHGRLPIVPLPDGNGRISRLLSLLLLYKNGFDAGKYISFEYDALQKSSRGWHENNQDYSAFIMEFITTVYACYKELDKRFAVIGSKRVTKQARIEATVLNSLTPISKADIGKILPDVSTTTMPDAPITDTNSPCSTENMGIRYNNISEGNVIAN